MQHEYSKDFITSIARGLEVIKCFDEQATFLTPAQVAAKTRLSRATSRRVLLTLTSLGYVSTDGKHYRLSPKVLDLCHAYLASTHVGDIIQPVIERAGREVEETCCVAVREDDDIVFIARRSSGQFDRLSIELGTRIPAHATAIGRAILSREPDDDRERYLSRAKLQAFTEDTITDKNVLRDTILLARSRGYAIVEGELSVGMCSVAVPILDRTGKVFGAVNFGGNSARINSGNVETRFVPALVRAATDIGRLIIT